jgi:hypothetical protein
MDRITDVLTKSLCVVHPRELIALLEFLRSAEFFALNEAHRRWDGSEESLLSVINGLCEVGFLDETAEYSYDLTPNGREAVNAFFDGIAWARRGGRWDQPLSVAFSTALALFDVSVREGAGRLSEEDTDSILKLLDTANDHEQSLPGPIFEAVWIGGGNAAASKPIRCGMVWGLKGRVYTLRGDLEDALEAFRNAYERFSRHGRADYAYSIQSEIEHVWNLITITRTSEQQRFLHKSLERWGTENLTEKWKYIWFNSELFTSRMFKSWDSLEAGETEEPGLPNIMPVSDAEDHLSEGMNNPETGITFPIGVEVLSSFREAYREIPTSRAAWESLIASYTPEEIET